MLSQPLFVLNALVLRGDSSPPEGARRARPGYNVNRAGEGIEDATTRDRTLAMSPTPQLEWEAYDEYWRKVHGPKILHPDGPNDQQTGVLTYYLQQHRLPAGPSSQRAPPYAPPLDAQGLLPRTPAASCAEHVRPAFDGMAQLGYRTRADLEAFFATEGTKYGEKIMPDEAVFIRGFAFHVAEEHVVIQRGDRRRDPVILTKLHQRASGLSREEFRGRWMAQHADLVRSLNGGAGLVRRYAQLVNIGREGDTLFDPVGDCYDGIGVYSFANMNDCEDFVGGADHAALVADERHFAAESGFFTTLNYVIRDLTT
jgi:hypothetical protein